jgi:hypothetical protein
MMLALSGSPLSGRERGEQDVALVLGLQLGEVDPVGKR